MGILFVPHTDLTIAQRLAQLSNRNPHLPAILAPERIPLTYHQLFSHIQKTVNILNKFGVGRNDRVALVMSEGPELTVAHCSVLCGATVVALNPAYQPVEF